MTSHPPIRPPVPRLHSIRSRHDQTGPSVSSQTRCCIRRVHPGATVVHATTANAPAILLQLADFPPLGGVRTVPVRTGVWTSGAGKAREPGGGVHRDGDGGGNSGPVSTSSVEGMERTSSKGQSQAQAQELMVPCVVSAPPSATVPVPNEDTCISDLTDGMNALALDKAQS
jgi:hypothetical protein